MSIFDCSSEPLLIPPNEPLFDSAPLDRRLVDKALLTPAEIAWWDGYHADVRRILAPRLEGDDLAWLERETRPL